MMKRLCYLLLNVVALAAVAQSTIPSELVPEELFRESRLEVSSDNFSIDSPAANWVWRRNLGTNPGTGTKVSMYKVSDPNSDASFVITTISMASPQFTDKDAESFLRGMLQKSESQGWVISGLQVKRSEVPASGYSHEYEYFIRSPSGRRTHTIGYLAGGERIYVLQGTVDTSEHVRLFRKFARSFKQLDAEKPALPGSSSPPAAEQISPLPSPPNAKAPSDRVASRARASMARNGSEQRARTGELGGVGELLGWLICATTWYAASNSKGVRNAPGLAFFVTLGFAIIVGVVIAKPGDVTGSVAFTLGKLAIPLLISGAIGIVRLAGPSNSKQPDASGVSREHPPAPKEKLTPSAPELADSLQVALEKGLEARRIGNFSYALKELRRPAEQGLAAAQYNLAGMYYNGEGIPQHFEEAAHWYRRAANQGLAGAQFYLGAMYSRGEGVPIDCVEAHKWCNLSAAGCSVSEMALREDSIRLRTSLANGMTHEQIMEAQRLAGEWRSVTESAGAGMQGQVGDYARSLQKEIREKYSVVLDPPKVSIIDSNAALGGGSERQPEAAEDTSLCSECGKQIPKKTFSDHFFDVHIKPGADALRSDLGLKRDP